MTTNYLEESKNRIALYRKYMQMEKDLGANPDKLAFLDAGVKESIYVTEIKNYPTYLREKPDGIKITTYGGKTNSKSGKRAKFTSYPKVGELPYINENGLTFLDPDIKQACICIGTFHQGELQSQWLGRNAMENTQFWSSTKIIPLINVISQMNALHPQGDIDDCLIRDRDQKEPDHSFFDLAKDVISYDHKIGSSNALSAMFKRFVSRSDLQQWTQQMTGNMSLSFQGDYGELPYLENPELFDKKSKKVLLSCVPNTPRGDNFVSAYDMTRLMSMIGWHLHLPQMCRLPGAQWKSIESLIRAMGYDSARYTDIALKTLGMEKLISSPVIISKLGHGFSDLRHAVETIYTAFLWLIDERPKTQGKAPKLRTLTLTLRGSKPVTAEKPFGSETIKLDASMATEVTEILRQIFTEELP